MKLPHILFGFGPMQVSFVNSGEKQINVYKSDTCNAYISQTLGLKYIIAFLGKHNVREPFQTGMM